MVGRSVGGRVESVAFASTHALVFDMPVLLLTLDGAVACVPAAVVHRLLLAVIALTHKPHFTAALLSLLVIALTHKPCFTAALSSLFTNKQIMLQPLVVTGASQALATTFV